MDPTIFSGSALGMSSRANLFDLPPTDVTVLASNYIAVAPQLNMKEAVLFSVPPSSYQYMDLASSYLYIKVQVLKGDGSNLAVDEVVAPSNMFFYNIFRNCSVSVNGTKVSDANGYYPYQAGIPTMLTNGRGEKETELTSILYYKDSKADWFQPDKNDGFKARQYLARESRIFDMVGPIPMPPFQQEKYLPTRCDVTVELTRQDPQFCIDCLDSTKAYKYEIVTAQLYVKMVTMNPKIVAKHEENFRSSKAQYPLRTARVSTNMIPVGTLSYEGFVNFGKLPTNLVVGLTTQTAMRGLFNKSPFNFQNFGLTKVVLSLDNNPALTQQIEVDFTNRNYLLGYQSLFKATGRRCDGNYIDREEYTRGNVLFLFNLQGSIGAEFHLLQTGRLKVSEKNKLKKLKKLILT
jgi:hypothetical protein